MKKYAGKFICVVEGAVATKYNGGYGKVGGRSFLEIAKEVVPKAAATIAIGTVPPSAVFRRLPPIRVDTKGVAMPGHETPQPSRLPAQPRSIWLAPSSIISFSANCRRWMIWDALFAYRQDHS
jgi:hypothetical protein